MDTGRTMQAMMLEQFDTALVLRTIPVPVLKKGQLLVRINASGTNPLDIKIKAGKAAHAQVQIPAVLGIDMAGVVTEISDGVTRFKKGDEVYGMVGGVGNNQGTLAEYIAVDEDHVARKPANITMKEAAAIPLTFITAWEGLVDRAKVHERQTVLVHGGAGGVGFMAVQIALAFGAAVYATDSRATGEYITNTGAVAIDYTTTSPEEYVKCYTGGTGFDIVFDTVGGNTLDSSFKSVKKYTGHVLSSLGWGTHSIAPLSFLGATYSGIFTLLPLLTSEDKAHHGDILQQATKLIEAGKLVPLVSSKTYFLKDANEAYNDLEKRINKGKVVIEIGSNKY